ncbi:MAG: cache domain-containing protein [Lachnospiraceae bacterium]|nr:cache domain-containing protein [Lachnospiraceae bacterium]
MKLKAKMLMTALLPLVIMAVAVSAYSGMVASNALKEEVKAELSTSVHLLRECIADGEGNNNFYVDKNNNLWNNEYNVTEDTEYVDKVKQDTGVVLTVFFGDTRYMTSVTKEDGSRALLTQAGPAVVEKVVKNGEEFFAENVDVVGQPYYAYYIPIYNAGSDAPVGMVFAGKAEATVNSVINSLITGIVVVAIIMIVLSGLLILVITNSISKGIGFGVKALTKVADGDLTIEIDDKLVAKKDETGDIVRAIENLKQKLTAIINDIVGHSNDVNDNAARLGEDSKQTSESIEQVERAVNEIADGATSQANDTTKATESVIKMGNLVEETNEDVSKLTRVSKEMEATGKAAADKLNDLENINDKTKVAIKTIYEETTSTNEAAKQISEAIALITSIAEETNLLSLNASIEAARAGDAGRGFAVVASQIQKLAEQSNESAGKIEEIANGLMTQSQHVVDTMDEVNTIIGQQNEIIVDSAECFKQVLEGINESRDHINAISTNMEGLNESRQSVVDVVSNLSAIAEENAASTEETSASTTIVTQTVQQIADSALELTEIAGKLEESVKVFKV